MNREATTHQRAEELLRTKKTIALIGATQDMLKYSYELMFTLLDAGYKVYPVNPRYDKIEEERCYHSLAELPEKPEVVIIVLSPQNTERAIAEVVKQNSEVVWLPPGSWSDKGVEKAKSSGMEVLYDVCPIGTLRKMHEE